MSRTVAMPRAATRARGGGSKKFLAAWLALWAVLAALLLYPVSTGTTRSLELLCACALWAGALALLRRLRAALVPFVAATACALVFVAMPGRAVDEASLRRAYVTSLAAYGGTRYVWGGEGRNGIDCSGLVRRGLIDADFRAGVATMNPRLLRESFSMWWHDASAKSLLAGYGGRTRELLSSPSIAELDHSLLLPGDIAVTADGLHTLAYVGDATWIEADPNPMRVVEVRADSQNPWLKVPVRVMRWRQFETAGRN